MDILWLLVPFSLFLGLLFLGGFLWMANHGQYDELDSAHLKMLIDEQSITPTSINSQKRKEHESDTLK